MAMRNEMPLIEAHFRIHPDALAVNEEWNGITNPILRRKLQNRLNQRALRRRKAASRNPKETGNVKSIQESGVQDQMQADLLMHLTERAKMVDLWLEPVSHVQAKHNAFRSLRDASQCRVPLAVIVNDRVARVQTLYRRILDERDTRALYPLPADHLLSLVYYNVYRGLVANVAVLGLDLNLMCLDEYPSPFTPCSSTATSAVRSLPPALQPTELQKTIAHHPQWDVVPSPRARDNLLRRGQVIDVDDVEFCLDLIGTEDRRQRAGNTSEHSGCLIWGDPWVTASWEVTESFVRKYPWLFEGDAEIERSTNYHRSLRDEPPIAFPRTDSLNN